MKKHKQHTCDTCKKSYPFPDEIVGVLYGDQPQYMCYKCMATLIIEDAHTMIQTYWLLEIFQMMHDVLEEIK